ncbi:MAG: exodeoxyribonuclease V subunit gamma [Methylophagaceae bacterium]
MLKIVYSNNMIELAARLADIQQSQPLSPLEVEIVIVQSNELARWLSLFLANHHGIASHLDFPYPSAFIWAIFRRLLPNIPQQSPFSTDALAWRLFELLPDCRYQAGFEPVNNYLGQQDDPLKRYGLAHRIADSFDQYLMYRPDWISAWEQGDKPHWQAKLWQLLTKGEATPQHRANLLTQLKEYLSSIDQRPDGLPSRLAIFGLSALPPVYLELFELMAKHCDIHLFFLSPSEEYWGDLVDPKTQAKRLIDTPDDEGYLTVGHPLLASLGKQGQVFFEQLQACSHEDEHYFSPPNSHTLLGQLQYDIFSLSDVDSNKDKHHISVDDDSIMIHSCHSTMREIEVLHDQLLALFERHPDVSPTDIVVMTPDIEIYTPWIEAVFGCTSPEHNIPYGIASGTKTHSRVITAFNSLLDLPQSRFDVESIVALLECEAIQNRFSLDEDQLELIRRWLRETQIRWGASAEDKAALGLPETEANTWQAGLDRLLLAYAMPLSSNDDWKLFEGKLGFNGISGDRAETMAQLCAFVESLVRCRQQLKADLNGQKWQHRLLRILDDFFSADSRNSNDEADLLLIRKTLDHFVETAELAEFKQTMNIDLVKEWLSGHLDENQSQTRFMGRGITFCGMVPMRSIPFKVVCLIGMNDDSYPRRQPRFGFDLLSTDFRQGDRSRREDDRYLFLESLLSAQQHFYISYVGANIADNSPIPPSVLVSDLKDVLHQDFEIQDAQIITQHPLQAFSQRYFNTVSDKLFSYDASNCPPDNRQTVNAVWFENTLPEADESWRDININQLLSFFRHPARYLCQQRLGLWLGEDDAQLESREPFHLDGLQAWQLRQQLLTDRLQAKDLAVTLPLIQATGVLPQGIVGEQSFENQLDQVDEFADKLLLDYPDQLLTAQDVDLKFDGFALSGQLDGLSPEGLFNYRMGKTKGNELLTAWIQHLILNCIKPEGVECHSRLITENNNYQFLAAPEANSLLQVLLEYYWQGLHQPLPLFSNTSFAFAKASLNDGRSNPENAMNKAWQGDDYSASEGDDLYYQQLYDIPPLDESFKELALTIYSPLQAHLVSGKL